ncbi:histone acetyltransferase TAF1 250 [Babesia ovata]|uniref:Histone acetyltransferase TAF1 250 n=1 Tax=Babesia ovata TaxID=189622 RepID=A0A2H6K9Z4_9APIC|nr:histone acetyltransferase TAF1 250 [Babesia ovata]GBE59805.1 histone acetyltransferase TAF1 250 [Babesia ovata]
MEGSGKMTPDRPMPGASAQSSGSNTPLNQPGGHAAPQGPMGDGFPVPGVQGDPFRRPDAAQSAAPGSENQRFPWRFPPMPGGAGPRSDGSAASSAKAAPSAKSASVVSSGESTMSEQMMPGQMPPGMMGMPGMPNFFPFPPGAMPGMPGLEGQGDNNSTIGGPKVPPLSGWMMDGMMPMGMMQSGSASIDGSLMPPMPYAPGTGGMKGEEMPPMPMVFFPPMMMDGLPEFAKDPNAKIPPINMMMPPLKPLKEENSSSQTSNQAGAGAAQKAALNKKASGLDSMKTILTLVQIRETCQLKAWRRKLHKGRAQMKLDAEAGVPPSRSGSDLAQGVPPVVEVASDDAEPAETQVQTVPTRQWGYIGLDWQANRYRSSDVITDEDMRVMRVFDTAADQDLVTICDALKRLDGIEYRCYPYMFMDELKLPTRRGRGSFRVWDDDDNELSQADDTPVGDFPSVRSVTPQADWIPAAVTSKQRTIASPSPEEIYQPKQPEAASFDSVEVAGSAGVNTIHAANSVSVDTVESADFVEADATGVDTAGSGDKSEPDAAINDSELDFSDLDGGSNASYDIDFDDAEISGPAQSVEPRNARSDLRHARTDTPRSPENDLENSLLELISDTKSVGAPGDMDLDDEFEFEAGEEEVAPPPAPPTYPLKASGVPDTGAAVDVSYTDDSDLFGEVPGTLSHYRAKICKLMNPGDMIHEWRGFKSRLVGPLLLADLVEFEHLWKVFQDRRVEDLCQVLGRSVSTPTAEPFPEQKGELLYRVGQAHMRLFYSYNSPEVQTLVRSTIYNLNAPNVIYTAVEEEEDITPTYGVSARQDTPTEGAAKEGEEPPGEYEESTARDDRGLPIRENELRRAWRRRIQSLAKETRLALVNMGKSLRDIGDMTSNAEQNRAYDAVVEFCEVAEQFNRRSYLTMLNQSFDDYYEKAKTHESGVENAGSNSRELLHTRIAMNLTGILPVCGKVAKYHNVRFHKPDFRAGLYMEHMRSQRGHQSTEWSTWAVRPLLKSNIAASYTEELGGSENRSHPSNYFIHSRDLCLNDDCKVALLEYIEQTPLVLPNCGMASRVDNYVNYREGDGIKLEFLGPLGTLCQGSGGINMFGVKHTLEPGEGQAMLESTLYKAPIFVHPLQGSESHKKLNITTTDFLLTRSRSNTDEVVMHLRPLTWQSGVAVYTVGQCEPKVDLHPPGSKAFIDNTYDLLKAWVLKSVMVGALLDGKHLRREARKKFGSVLSEKEISQVLKQVENTPIFSLRAQALERMIHSTIKPETVCAMESVRAAKTRLATVGILRMRNPDKVGGVYAKIQDEERQHRQRIQAMDRRLKDLKNSYAKRLEAHGISGERLETEIKQFDFGIHVSLYGHLEERYMTPQIRFIRDMLQLTPWSISRDVRQVLNNRGASQFCLYGIGDPSGGRGEGISLLKRQAQVNLDTTYTGEDLRKLSMLELAKRLRCYGVADAVIRSLPRWDQVALVRQYRDGFGVQGVAEGDHRWRIPPEEYQKKINEILIRQRAALATDDPVFSDGERPQDSEPEPATDGIADALMEAFDETSDKDDDLERRELDILRQLREAQSAGPLTEEERMAEVNKLKAVPGVMWLRQSRRTPNEPFGNERAMFVFGVENMRKLLKWRVEYTRTVASTEHEPADPNSRRVCQVCGRVAKPVLRHKTGTSKGERGRGGNDAAAATRKQSRLSDDSDAEVTASVSALQRDTTEWLNRNPDPRHKRRLVLQVSLDDSDDDLDSVDEGALINTRRKHPRSSAERTTSIVEAPSGNMEQVMKLVSKAIRIVEKDPRFKPFTSRIPESVAPNYYHIIKNPMWLSLLKSKCKTRCYADILQVLDDMALIEQNCKQFNSETSANAWLRRMSEVLVDELLFRIQQMTTHLLNPGVLEEWAREHRANRVVAAPAPQANPTPVTPPPDKLPPPHYEEPIAHDEPFDEVPRSSAAVSSHVQQTGPEDSLDREDYDMDDDDFGDSFYEEWHEKMENFHPSSMLSMDVAPKSSEIFYENVRNSGTLLRGMFYTLSKIEELKVRLTIKSPSGDIMYTKEAPDGIYSFEAKVTGVYEFEFHNPHWLTSVGLTISAGSDEHSVLESKHIKNTQSRLEQLKNNVDSIYAQFKYLWLHNHRQMRASRDTQFRLLLYSLVQFMVVGVCSAICVTYVKKIVSHKRLL